MSEKLLSIIVPSYNMEKYLHKCLSSLIIEPEKMNKLDVIVVNDGSTDRTSEIAHEFADKYPGVFRVIDKQNGHYGSCVNAALPLIRGQYVRLLDADDYFDTVSFSEFMNIVNRHCVEGGLEELVLTDYSKVDEEGGVISEYKQPWDSGIITIQDLASKIASGNHYNAMPGVTYKSCIFRDLHYVQSEGVPYTDEEWIIYPLKNVKRIKVIHLNIYKYLIGRQQQSTSSDETNRAMLRINPIVVKRFIACYDEIISNERNKAYALIYKRSMYHKLVDIYNNVLMYGSSFVPGYNLTWLDDMVSRHCSDVYVELAQYQVARFIPSKIISYWRNGARIRLWFVRKWLPIYTSVKNFIKD